MKITIQSLVALGAFSSASLQAATIAWGTATTVAGASDVSTSGTVKQALSFGTSTATITVNTVAFTGVSTAQLGGAGTGEGPVVFGSGEGAISFTEPPGNSITGDEVFLGNTGDTGYNTLMQGAAFTNVGTQMTLRLQGLVNTQQYEIQFWSVDGRSIDIPERTTTYTTGANSVGLIQGIRPGVNGQWVTGTFTADGTTQNIDVTSVGSALINAYQLRAIPEPSSVALLGLSGLAVILRRRKS